MKSPKWVATTRQLIKSKHGFGWSISGWERKDKNYSKERQEIRQELRRQDEQTKKMGGVVDWNYLQTKNNNGPRDRYDQETLFILSRLYKSIKIESWLKYKLTGRGIRRFIDFESLKNY